MSPANIILEKVTFTNEEELAKVKEQAKNIFGEYPFFNAAYIYKNCIEKQIKETVAKAENSKSGLNIFSVLAESEIKKILGRDSYSDEEEEYAGFLRELIDSNWNFQEAEAAEQKSKVKLNKPFRTPSGPKKFGVYVRNDKGNIVLVRFGDKNMSIKRDDPERRKNFRARHGCDNPGPKWKAKYWSCKMWSSKPVSEIASEEEFEKTLLTEEEFSKLSA